MNQEIDDSYEIPKQNPPTSAQLNIAQHLDLSDTKNDEEIQTNLEREPVTETLNPRTPIFERRAAYTMFSSFNLLFSFSFTLMFSSLLLKLNMWPGWASAFFLTEEILSLINYRTLLIRGKTEANFKSMTMGYTLRFLAKIWLMLGLSCNLFIPAIPSFISYTPLLAFYTVTFLTHFFFGKTKIFRDGLVAFWKFFRLVLAFQFAYLFNNREIFKLGSLQVSNLFGAAYAALAFLIASYSLIFIFSLGLMIRNAINHKWAQKEAKYFKGFVWVQLVLIDILICSWFLLEAITSRPTQTPLVIPYQNPSTKILEKLVTTMQLSGLSLSLLLLLGLKFRDSIQAQLTRKLKPRLTEGQALPQSAAAELHQLGEESRLGSPDPRVQNAVEEPQECPSPTKSYNFVLKRTDEYFKVFSKEELRKMRELDYSIASRSPKKRHVMLKFGRNKHLDDNVSNASSLNASFGENFNANKSPQIGSTRKIEIAQKRKSKFKTPQSKFQQLELKQVKNFQQRVDNVLGNEKFTFNKKSTPKKLLAEDNDKNQKPGFGWLANAAMQMSSNKRCMSPTLRPSCYQLDEEIEEKEEPEFRLCLESAGPQDPTQSKIDSYREKVRASKAELDQLDDISSGGSPCHAQLDTSPLSPSHAELNLDLEEIMEIDDESLNNGNFSFSSKCSHSSGSIVEQYGNVKEKSSPMQSIGSEKAQASYSQTSNSQAVEEKKSKFSDASSGVGITDQKRKTRLMKLMKKQQIKKQVGNRTLESQISPEGIQESNLCLICIENEQDCIFQPCGHGSCCFSCASQIVAHSALCYFCREEITKVLRIDKGLEFEGLYKVKEVFKVKVEEKEEK